MDPKKEAPHETPKVHPPATCSRRLDPIATHYTHPTPLSVSSVAPGASGMRIQPLSCHPVASAICQLGRGTIMSPGGPGNGAGHQKGTSGGRGRGRAGVTLGWNGGTLGTATTNVNPLLSPGHYSGASSTSIYMVRTENEATAEDNRCVVFLKHVGGC